MYEVRDAEYEPDPACGGGVKGTGYEREQQGKKFSSWC